MVISINNQDSYSSKLERDLAQVLANLLNTASWLKRWRVEACERATDRPWDLKASGPIPGGGRAILCVEGKGINFQPSQFSSVAGRACPAIRHALSVKVLGMPRVSPRMAALCSEQGWSWFDLAGNCRLEIPGALLIER